MAILTTTNQGLNFIGGTTFIQTGTTTVMSIKTNGNVGIGLTSPSAPLSLAKPSLTTTGTGEGGLRVHRPNALSQYGYFDYGFGGGGVNIGSLYTGGGATSFGTFTFRQHSSTTSQIPMFIDNTGNVGVGTTSPGAKLEISHGGANNGLLLENTLNSSNHQIALNIRENEGLIFQRWISGVFNGNLMRIGYTGAIKFDAYDGTNNTGTPTYVLGTDASGNVVKVLGGDIPGVSGQFLPLTAGSTKPLTGGLFGTTASFSDQVDINGFTNNKGLSFRTGFTPTNVGIMAKAIGTANRDGLAIFGYNGIDFVVNNGSNVVMRVVGVTGSGMGNVGIGTTSPSVQLEVAKSATIGAGSVTSSTTNFENVLKVQGKNNYSDGNTWFGSYGQILLSADTNMTGSARQFLITNALDNNKFAIVRSVDGNTTPVVNSTNNGSTPNSGSADFVIDNTGNIGINKTSPNEKLEVNGAVAIGTSADGIKLRLTGTVGEILGLSTTSGSYNDLDIRSQAATQLYLKSNGNVGIRNTNPQSTLHLGDNANSIGGTLRLDSFVANQFWKLEPGTNTLNIKDYDGTSLASFDGAGNYVLFNGGNVGIGTTSPNEKLRVVSTTSENAISNTVKISHARSNTDLGTNALYVDVNLSGADATTADRQNRGIFVDVDSTADGDASNEHRIRGVNSDVRFSGFSDAVQAGYFHAESNNNTVKTAQLAGVFGNCVHDSSTTNGGVSNMYGVYGNSDIQDLGDVDNAFGGFFQVNIGTPRGNANIGVTKGVEGQINIDKATTIDYGTMSAVSAIIDNNEGAVPNFGNQFLFKGDYQGTRGSDAYGIYCEGDKHYLEGKLAVNLATPTQALHVAGNARVTGAYYDSNNSPGTANQVLVSTVTGTDWVDGSGSSIIGGPYLPLSAGPSYPLTGDLYQTMGTIGVAQTDQDYIAKIYELNSDGFLSLYTGQGTPLEKVRISSYGNSFFVPANNGKIGIGTTSPLNKLTVEESNTGTQVTTVPVGKFINTGNAFSKLILGSNNSNFDGVVSMDNDSTLANTKLRIYIGNGTTATTGHLNDHIVLQGNGNVGIGTNDPDEKLVLYKNINYNSDSALFSAYAVNSTAVNNNEVFKWRTGITGNQSGHSLTFSTLARTQSSYVERMRIDFAGNVRDWNY